MTSTYQPGVSVLHRAGAGVKLAGLLVFSTLLVALKSPVTVLVGLVLVAGLYVIAGFGVRTFVVDCRLAGRRRGGRHSGGGCRGSRPGEPDNSC